MYMENVRPTRSFLVSFFFLAMPEQLVLMYVHNSKRGNTAHLNISFSMENEKRAAQMGFKPTTRASFRTWRGGPLPPLR